MEMCILYMEISTFVADGQPPFFRERVQIGLDREDDGVAEWAAKPYVFQGEAFNNCWKMAGQPLVPGCINSGSVHRVVPSNHLSSSLLPLCECYSICYPIHNSYHIVEQCLLWSPFFYAWSLPLLLFLPFHFRQMLREEVALGSDSE